MGDIRMRLASLSVSASLLVVVGFLGGCGDNMPRGGTGGTGGGVAGKGGGGQGGTGALAGAGGLGGEAGASVDGGAGADGAAGTGGTAGVGGAGGMAVPCYTGTAFTTPATNNLTLTVSDDTDHTCADGFQYSVEITSGAPDNTQVSLYDGNTLLKTTTVMSGTARFDVQLSSGGTAQALSIQYPSTSTCNVTTMVTVNCSNNAPTCTISQPVISATHPALNGVATPAGDRVSSAGSNYQATFKVQTSAEDGQPITLAVDNQTSASVVTTLNATASGGVATFTATLVPDGTYEAVATCTNKNGISATSTKGTFPVDTSAPDLTVTSPTAGQFVVGANVNVCGKTAATDAAGLASSLGAAQNNYCVTVGSAATPTCTPVTAVNTATCVAIPCPGAAAFNLTVTLNDAAGNPTSQTITGVTCVSSLPSVQIIAPDSDAPTFTDATKHILAASAPTGIKDLDANTAGAQVNVVACTDTVGAAILKVGHQGDATLTQLGGSVATAAAVAADNCPANLPNVVKFSGVTLPESSEDATGALTAATELTVTVTSSANSQSVGTSQPDDVWVDTVVPMVGLSSPTDLCTQFMVATGSVPQDVAFTADDKLVVLDVTNGATTTTYDTPAFMNGIATFPNVTFGQGQNKITVAESDPAGNAVAFTPAACTVTIGMAPVVTFTTPTAGALLCPSGDATTGCIDDNDTGTTGWQGSLGVNVTVSGQPVTTGDAVTFSIGGNSLGSANLDNTGHAQLNAVTIPEGVQTITATTATITNAGVGVGTVTVTVDTLPPNAPTGLNVIVLDRRKANMQLTWTAPSDGNGGNVTGYQVRYAKVPIDSTNFNDATVTTAVPYTGAPANAGQVDGLSVTGLYIENNYYFAVQAVDTAGSVSAIVATPAGSAGTCTCGTNCCATHFNQTKIPSTSGTNESFGRSVSAGGDLNGDGLSDLAVGTLGAGKAYLFFGSTTFSTTAPAPSVVFSGSTTGFGASVEQIGDIDDDGLGDLAISDPLNGLKVYIYKGRQTWPATLTDADANYVVSADASYAGSLFGLVLARLGDFTGDGVDDFAIAARNYNSSVGRVVVIPGQPSVNGVPSFASVTLPDITNAIVIDGDATLSKSFFGYKVIGLGHFYGVTRGTTMVVSAEGSGSGTSPGNNGHIYTFHGQTGTSGSISVSSADEVLAGPGAAAHIGITLTDLGAITGFPGVGIGNISDNIDPFGGAGGVYLALGTPTTGLFQSIKLGYITPDTTNGGVLLGGGVAGRDVSLSLIGDSTPDVVIGGEGGPVVGIADGAKLASKPSPNDYGKNAEVLVPLSGWSSGEGNDSLIRDINGDGVPDFCLGGTGQPGAVLVLW